MYKEINTELVNIENINKKNESYNKICSKTCKLDNITSLENKLDRILCIIPCYNEEITIGSIVIKCKQYVDEVLVIDDGSNDKTSYIAKNAGAVVLSHNRNLGKAAGIKTGFKYALENKFDYAITIDGDGQHNADEIPQLLNKLISSREKGENVDISLGSRSGSNTEMPNWRRVGKRVLDYATSFGNGGLVTDSQCGFRVFSKKAVKAIYPKLKGDAFSLESEQLILANELGLGITQANVTCKYKSIGNSKSTSTKKPTSHGFGVLSYVIWIVAEKRPLLFIGIPGLIFLLTGIFWGIRTLQIYNTTHIFIISYAILTSIFLIIGSLAMFIGLTLNVLPRIIKRAREGIV